MACTATATPKVAEEIVARLGLREPERVRSGFDRPEPLLRRAARSTARARSPASARRSLAGVAMAENRPAVVYCGTRKRTEEIADLLAGRRLRVVAYHAGMARRGALGAQDAFMRGDVDVVVATNAFGMGVDKADVRSVWHWALPSQPRGLLPGGRPRGPRRRSRRAPCCSPRARTSAGSCASSARRRSTRRAGRALVGRLRARADETAPSSSTPATTATAIALAVAERAGALTLAPGQGGRIRVELATGELDTRPLAELCRAATDRRWQSYRSIERYAADATTAAAAASSSTTSAIRRRARPTGRCCDVHDPPDWLPPITRRRSAHARQASAAEDDGPPVADGELAPLKAWRKDRADGKPAYTVGDRRDAARGRPPRSRARRDELLAIKGIGPSFVDKHADSLLELLQAS